jgi:pectate lyase-like protein
MKHLALILVLLGQAARGPQSAGDFVPPSSDPILNVQKDCGAKGDGTTDDTAALKQAFEAGKTQPHPKFGAARDIYIPNGTYLVSETLNVGDKKKFIIGQSREKTIIRLKPGSKSFQESGKPRPVINYGDGSYKGWHFAQNFNQRMVNLTLEVGAQNPGAMGILYHTNNLGSMHHVSIRSLDPQKGGAVGLDLSSGPGPGLIWDLDVDGFEVGVKIDGGLHSMTLGKIKLTNQKTTGYLAAGNMTSLWGLTSINKCPAVTMNKGHMVLLDSSCTGGEAAQAAVKVAGGVFFCRNLSSQGYGKALSSSDAREFAGPKVDEFVRPKAYALFSNEPKSLNLPVEAPPPMSDWSDSSKWAVIQPGKDSAQRIQKAIDDGAETVYLTGGSGLHEFNDTIHLRKNVRRIFGAGADYRTVGKEYGKHSRFELSPEGKLTDEGCVKPAFRLEDGTPETVSIEFISDTYGSAGWGIDHASKRTLVCRAVGGLSYRNSVTGGKAFFLDSGPSTGSVIKGPQQVWAWQTNTESYEHNPHIVNDGGMLFICGYKIEKDRTNVGTINGGWTEVLGGLLYKNRQRIGMAPAFINFNSNMTVSIAQYGVAYDSLVDEVRGSERKSLSKDILGGQWIPLYSGWQKPYAGTAKH